MRSWLELNLFPVKWFLESSIQSMFEQDAKSTEYNDNYELEKLMNKYELYNVWLKSTSESRFPFPSLDFKPFFN